jgi:hypothetical protein
MMRASSAGLALLTALCCSPVEPPAIPAATASSLDLDITPVRLDPGNPGARAVGSFAYAGGLEIRDPSSTIRELSDLRIIAGNGLLAVSDHGYFFEAQLLLDGAGQLTGLAGARVIPLTVGGKPLTGLAADAEALEILSDGARLVGFERDHRIWRYPPDGGDPQPAPGPAADFPANEGMEAITLFPAAGTDAYLVGSEGGMVWLCRLSSSCSPSGFAAPVPEGLALTSLAAYGTGGMAVLGRQYDPRRGTRISVRLVTMLPDGRFGGVVDEMSLAPPLLVDNFEGIAAAARPDGSVRLYLVSDDNGSAAQRTYLIAFDWKAKD